MTREWRVVPRAHSPLTGGSPRGGG
ncbi:MAG: hypothetical protein QOF99_3147, partial [Pseudonocardiales bacterium]|nr:hypothetical protein [Pseudonocardiales bacterium]